MSDQTKGRYETLGTLVGELVDAKNKAYGDSFDQAGEFLKLLYPNGITPEQYSDMLALVRVFDKMKRIASDRDALGESPFADIAGYGLLGLLRVLREKTSASNGKSLLSPFERKLADALGLGPEVPTPGPGRKL